MSLVDFTCLPRRTRKQGSLGAVNSTPPPKFEPRRFRRGRVADGRPAGAYNWIHAVSATLPWHLESPHAGIPRSDGRLLPHAARDCAAVGEDPGLLFRGQPGELLPGD